MPIVDLNECREKPRRAVLEECGFRGEQQLLRFQELSGQRQKLCQEHWTTKLIHETAADVKNTP
ncbi:MAG TPA: hypothetical protein VF424_09010 [Vicinamibacterales bacterium]